MIKAIDTEGRLFGVNIIDFIALFLILLIIPCVWFGYKVYSTPRPKTIMTIETKEYNKLIDTDSKVTSFLKEYPKYKSHF